MVLLISAPAWRGSGASFAKIATGLSRAGHRPRLFAADAGVVTRVESLGIPARQLPLARTGLREARRLAEALKDCSADLVLTDSPRDIRLATLATVFRRIPIVFRYNLSGRSLPGDPVSRLLQRRISQVVYQSHYARERALRTSPWLGWIPSRLIGNGYDGDRLRPCRDTGLDFRARHAIPAGQPVILSAAALFRDKGYPLAFQAMANLAQRLSFTWLIAGDGAERSGLETEAAGLKLPVTFLGSIPSEDLAAAMQAADVLLHPAPGELFPNVVAEGMALERPVVALDSGAAPELVGRDRQAGLLVADGDPVALADAVGELLQAPSLRRSMGIEARRRLLAEFPLERMERAYVQLVDDCTGPAAVVSTPSPAGLTAR